MNHALTIIARDDILHGGRGQIHVSLPMGKPQVSVVDGNATFRLVLYARQTGDLVDLDGRRGLLRIARQDERAQDKQQNSKK
jgi:hypothetical protein